MIKAITNWIQILAALGVGAILVFILTSFEHDSFTYIFAKIVAWLLVIEYLGVYAVRIFTNCVSSFYKEKHGSSFAAEMMRRQFEATQKEGE